MYFPRRHTAERQSSLSNMSDDTPTELAEVPDMRWRFWLRRFWLAIVAVSVRPSRRAYADQMRVIQTRRIPSLVILLCSLTAVNVIFTTVLPGMLGMQASDALSTKYLFGNPSLLGQLIFALVLSPWSTVLALAIVVYIVAAMVSSTRGDLHERILVVLRPYLLAQIVVAIIYVLIGLLIFSWQWSGLIHLAPVSALAAIINVSSIVYVYIASINSLAAVSIQSRWVLFAVIIVGGVGRILLGWLLPGAIFALFGIPVLPLSF